jgi:hypothetical protein
MLLFSKVFTISCLGMNNKGLINTIFSKLNVGFKLNKFI